MNSELKPQEKEPEENPPIGSNHNYKMYFWGLITLIILVIGLFIFDSYKKQQSEKIKQQERLKYEAEHQKFVNDSLYQVARNKEIYEKQLRAILLRDSAFATLRYKIGDVVYLKPDSIRGVIMNVESDSMMFNYQYQILISNKSNDPEVYFRKDKLIY